MVKRRAVKKKAHTIKQDKSSLKEIAAKALTPVAEDFATASRPKTHPSTGEALGRIANIAANKAHGIVSTLDKLTSFKTYVAGWQHVEANIIPLMKAKIEAIPPEDRQEPPPLIAGPILEAAKFTGNDPALAEMFAELLAGAMNKKCSDLVHPSYVEIIKNLTSDEAKLFKFMGDNDGGYAVIDVQAHDKKGNFAELVSNFSYVGKKAGLPMSPSIKTQISSLCRLGIAEIPNEVELSDVSLYEELENAPELKKIRREITKAGDKVVFNRKVIRITVFGIDFYEVCVERANIK